MTFLANTPIFLFIKISPTILFAFNFSETIKGMFDDTAVYASSYSINYIDWEHPENNVFHVSDEFEVEKRNSKQTRRPDIVLFVNGIPHVIIADQDYVEQVGSPEIKGLFALDPKTIKKDVIDNPRSLDGAALVASVDEAFRTGDLSSAQDVWEYIKSRRRKLKADLSSEEKEKLSASLAGMRKDGTFILSMGALEAYLPEKFEGKDLNVLIPALEDSAFFNSLDANAIEEFSTIGRYVFENQPCC